MSEAYRERVLNAKIGSAGKTYYKTVDLARLQTVTKKLEIQNAYTGSLQKMQIGSQYLGQSEMILGATPHLVTKAIKKKSVKASVRKSKSLRKKVEASKKVNAVPIDLGKLASGLLQPGGVLAGAAGGALQAMGFSGVPAAGQTAFGLGGVQAGQAGVRPGQPGFIPWSAMNAGQQQTYRQGVARGKAKARRSQRYRSKWYNRGRYSRRGRRY